MISYYIKYKLLLYQVLKFTGYNLIISSIYLVIYSKRNDQNIFFINKFYTLQNTFLFGNCFMSSMTTPILDNFNRADGAVGSNWTSPVWTGDGSFSVISNQFGAVSGTTISMYWSASSFSEDQEAYVTIMTPPANDSANVVSVYCRLSGQGTASPTYYAATLRKLSGTDTVTIERVIGGTVTAIGSAKSIEFASGDGLALTCVGGVIASWRRSGSTWVFIDAVNNTDITGGGYIGIESRQVARLDDFGGGNYVPIRFPTTPIRDTFNRSDESAITTASNGETWAIIPDQGTLGLGSVGVSSNVAYSTAGPGSFDMITTTDAADCEAYVTISTKGSSTNDEVDVDVRLQQYSNALTMDGYAVRAIVQAGTDTISIVRIDNVVTSALITFNQEFSSGDAIGIRCTGSIIEAFYRSGSSGPFTRLGGIVDSTYPNGGRTALTLVGTNTRADNFGGGAYIQPVSGSNSKGVLGGVLNGVFSGAI